MLESDFICDHASIQEELHELAESHRIGLGFGERCVDFVESLLVSGLQHNRVMS